MQVQPGGVAAAAEVQQYEQEAVQIQAVMRGKRGRSLAKDARRKLGKAIFEKIVSFDTDSNGFIDKNEMKAYLKAVGVWETDPLYTEAQWPEGWPIVCQLLGAQTHGIPMQSFLTYTERYRKGNLNTDLSALSRLSG